MLWQDLVITIATFVFSISLLPQVLLGFKKKKGLITLATSGPTFLALYVVAVVYFTLSLYLSFVVGLITATLWLILFLQKLRYRDV
ncbi:MAG: hypothetical protein KKH52_01670 [Nanoarchaeota archaeon]|nr:hypothetical protein [Nanoarchaeota archaeon]MBU1974080.1 hypothetical protein [Nanoarchaeota archaeon]